ncbi:diguanylate cyclase (GGDEF) domain-containing protein [Halomonas shengliensis]|uniref:Diguanylate cyclase (GGDEF) domain-containing protein n=1 Tax=Halomonas shengliensis TaxID=419597 RepID=A0A1H0EX33_9GAMM|nr:bifunctional diguanylate cyclase/phosphodiesterase [Halomonas shengliensis]SDN86932.1 diguanylate cyclase (GGDEF) domain-containing protein [Halomonas shengliensis]
MTVMWESSEVRVAAVDPLVEELEQVLAAESLVPLFQPIVDGQRMEIFGYEALIRGPSDSPLHSPMTLFDTAGRAGRLVELDLLCRRLAIQRFSALGLDGLLFLNVMPLSLVQEDFREGLTASYLALAGLSCERVVIELTEHTPIHDYQVMRQAVDHYRSMGFRVAIDDLGAGYAGLRHWSELTPDFVKIDRHFVQDVDRDPNKRQFLASLLDVSRGLGCQVIAEGIETHGEHRCLDELGGELLQGYRFARPALEPPRRLDLPDADQASHDTQPSARQTQGTLHLTAGMLSRHEAPLHRKVRVPDALSRFRETPALRCIAVLDDEGRPVGVLRQPHLLGLFANPFSHSLYARRTLEEVMDTQMVVVEERLPLELLSARVTEAPEGLAEDFVIVDSLGRYRGIGHIIDLLREITALQVRSARQANPLSGLPGNQAVQQVLAECLADQRPFCAIYCDLDNFKAYNDAYGYAAGDQMILALARLLSEQAGEGDFVGHLGGDDFMLVLEGELGRCRPLCEAILERFDRFVPMFYTEADRRRGGIEANNRQGQRVTFPLMSLSMALHPVSPGVNRSALDISNVLAELKAQAKKRTGSTLFIDRRH